MSESRPGDVEMLQQDGYVEARYLGDYSLESYKKRMEVSVRDCIGRKQHLLLVDVRGLAGYPPSLVDRHKIGVYGAELSRDLKKVAIVVLPAQIGEEPFSTIVASNRGLRIRAFFDRDKAVEWLRDPA